MRLILFIFCSITLMCCISKNKNVEKQEGAVIFSFDDQYVNDWFNYKDIFSQYNIKATFFICRPQQLKPIEISHLKLLESEGHEIACHSTNHLNALTFQDSIDSYINQEILPAKNILSDYGFIITSFAYPYGKSTPDIDSAVNNHFTYIRKATWNYNDTTLNSYNEIFATKNSHNIINAMGIDTGYDITLENIKLGIERAKKENEVLILFAHQIIESSKNSMIEPTHLEDIFKLCSDKNIKSIRIKDLDTFFYESEIK